VVVIDECVLIRNALYLAQGNAEDAETRRGVIRRGVIAWHPVFVSVGVLFVGVSFYGTLLPGSLAGAERLGDWLRRLVYMLSDKQCMCAVA
jgi:hypothetical protein